MRPHPGYDDLLAHAFSFHWSTAVNYEMITLLSTFNAVFTVLSSIHLLSCRLNSMLGSRGMRGEFRSSHHLLSHALYVFMCSCEQSDANRLNHTQLHQHGYSVPYCIVHHPAHHWFHPCSQPRHCSRDS